MATKEELSEELNQILGTELSFKRMTKDDLELLVELADDGSLIEPQVKHVVSKHGKQTLENQIDDWRPGKIVARLL